MAIYVGDKQAHIFRGDHKPVNMYLGSRKIAGWSPSSQTAAEPSWARTYNDGFDALTLTGNTVQAVTVQGKNLLDQSRIQHGYIDGSGNISYTGSLADNHYITPLIKVTPAQTYALSATVNKNYLGLVFSFDANKGYISNASAVGNSFTVGINTHYVMFRTSYNYVVNNGDVDMYNANWQLELGSTATEYEPFVPNSPSPEYPSYPASAGGILRVNGASVAEVPELNGLSGVGDTLNLLTGNGSERIRIRHLKDITWRDAQYGARGIFYAPSMGSPTYLELGTGVNVLCSHFAPTAASWGSLPANTIQLPSNIDGSGSYVVCKPVIAGVVDLVSWVNWLNANDPIIIYPRATFVPFTIAPLVIPTHYPQTAITQDNAVKASITAAVKVAD